MLNCHVLQICPAQAHTPNNSKLPEQHLTLLPYFLSISLHMLSVRLSIQTIALCRGLPLALSQTTVVSRWLVMPRALMLSLPHFFSACLTACCIQSCTPCQISSGSCSIQLHPTGRLEWSCWCATVCCTRTSRAVPRLLPTLLKLHVMTCYRLGLSVIQVHTCALCPLVNRSDDVHCTQNMRTVEVSWLAQAQDQNAQSAQTSLLPLCWAMRAKVMEACIAHALQGSSESKFAQVG